MTQESNSIQGTGWFAAPNFIFEADLDPYEIAILINLYRRAGADGSSFPGIRRLAEDTGMNKDTALNRIESLEDKGWIEIHRKKREGTNAKAVNVYTLKHQVKFNKKKRVSHETGQGVPRDGTGVYDEIGQKDDSVKDKTNKEEGATSNSCSEGKDIVDEQIAATLDEEPSLPPAVEPFKKQIHQQLTQKYSPKPKHLNTLTDLYEQYSDDLEDVITYAFDEFIPEDSWMRGKPRTWGTVMHVLPDAAADWEGQEDDELFDLSTLMATGAEEEEEEEDDPVDLCCPECGEIFPDSSIDKSGDRLRYICPKCEHGIALRNSYKHVAKEVTS